MRGRARRIVFGGLAAGVVAVGSAWMAARTALVMSLPDESGTVTLAGLGTAVAVERDALGIPTIRGESLADVSRALGFVHAQERFFQMDVTRRYAAGRMAELLGEAGLTFDRRSRPMLLERRARAIIEALPGAHRELVRAYAEGVNAGLDELDAWPPEYLALRAKPEAWRPSDTVLCVLFMFSTLSMGGPIELSRDTVHGVLGPEAARFLFQDTSRFDAPLDGAEDWSPMAVPDETVIDLRRAEQAPPAAVSHADPVEELAALGSNNWAVAGSRTGHGGAIVADDMHLGLNVPNTWFRARMEWGGRVLEGLSLPGAPAVVVGSNGDVAWGFTNVCGDFEDYVRVEVMKDTPGQYRTAEGSEAFTTEVEVLNVRGGEPERLELRRTRWGVVTERDHAGAPLVLKWIALEPGGFNLELFELMQARTLEEAVDAARRWYGPPQNVLIADSKGRIAWAVSGWLPRREGFDGTLPMSWVDGGVGWTGTIAESERPVVVDPPEGILFTANNRTLGIERARTLGTNWTNGYRAQRIAELLRAGRHVSERDMLAVQLDTRNEPMDFYRDLVLAVVDAEDASALTREARALVAEWNGRADADQAGYRILRRYVRHLERAIIDRALRPCRQAREDFRWSTFMRDEPLRRVLEERPANWLPGPATSWDAFLRDRFAETARELEKGSETEPAGVGRRWGEANRAMIQHPVSRILGGVAWLDMPRDEQPGDTGTVRVSASRFGASQRMVVSPGREGQGIMHMPAGQSGHPLSRHYRDGHAAWATGQASGFAAGPAERSLRLIPAP